MTRRPLVLAAAVAALALGGAVGTAAAGPIGMTGAFTKTFVYTGAAESFAVGPDVCHFTVSAYGAQGGTSAGIENASGGLGGHATVRIAVVPGETLDVRVGGAGGNGEDVVGIGGFNGGGDGGSTDTGLGGTFGAGGGGASDVRRGATRLVVAGGGGAAGAAFQTDGGAGGGSVGLPGMNQIPPDQTDGRGGGGGTQDGFGAGGAGGLTFGTGSDGDTPTVGHGGSGGSGGDAAGGGGGGGGYHGGGGGGGGGAAGGGGGSGFGPADTAFETGVRMGNGEVKFTYDPSTDVCPPATAPGAPTIDGITPTASGQATVRFSPPSDTGSSPITGYVATCGAQFNAGTSSPIVISGLSNGGPPIQCTVKAQNDAGFGPDSAPRNFTPGVPWGPFNITGAPGPVTGSVVVNWTAAQTNGAAIQSYLVTCVPWNPSLFPTRSNLVLGSAHSAQVNKLAPGQAHNCSVVATNSRGPGNPQDAKPVGRIAPRS